MDGGSSTTLTNMGIASLPSAEISDDGGHGGDAFLPAVSVDSDGSTVDGGFSLSGKVSRSNASSYCRVVQPSENSGNAIFFENAEDPGTSEGQLNICLGVLIRADCHSLQVRNDQGNSSNVHSAIENSRATMCSRFVLDGDCFPDSPGHRLLLF